MATPGWVGDAEALGASPQPLRTCGLLLPDLLGGRLVAGSLGTNTGLGNIVLVQPKSGPGVPVRGQGFAFKWSLFKNGVLWSQ